MTINNFKKNSLFPVYFFGFLFAFYTALPTFINSSFLGTFISEKSLGIVYIFASIITIIFFLLTPVILRKIGNYKFSLYLVLLGILTLIGLLFFHNPVWLLICFVVNLVVVSALYLSLDIFLESLSQNKETGKIRGIYLTLINLAWVFSPLIVGFFLANENYQLIYFLSILFLLPALFILIFSLKNFTDSKYESVSIIKTGQEVFRNKNIRNIFMATFLLNFFYSWMTIYTPIYLHKYAGLDWGQIGIVFGIMLLPFVLFQFPLGKIADESLGEKEILSVGFFIISAATVLIYFIPLNSSVWLWTLILFATRIGASSVEVMCDTYFFKKINSLNTNIISFFRTARSWAYILGPLLATVCLGFLKVEFNQLFVILAVIMLWGIWLSFNLKDTK
jgi:MFS family permease